MNTGLLLLIITVGTALVFDFLNGFHDAANSIATVFPPASFLPNWRSIWAAVLQFCCRLFLGTAVAKTIGNGMIRLDDVTQYVVIAGLAGRDRLGSADLVVGSADFVFARPDRRLCRGSHGARRVHARHRQRVLSDHSSGLDQDTDLYRGRSHHGIRAGLRIFMVAIYWILRDNAPQPGGQTGSANCNCCRPPPTAWATAATMRRRPWASSPARFHRRRT